MLAGGCNAERIGYRQAAERHGEHIAYISAYAGFLPDSPGASAPEAGPRLAAQTAQREIMRHAATSYDLRSTVQDESAMDPIERVATAFGPMVASCAIDPRDDDDQRWRKSITCKRSIPLVNAELYRHERRAIELGLPQGTFPRIEPRSAHTEARKEAESLLALTTPSPAEQARRKLFAQESAGPAALREACAASLAAAQGGPPEILQEIQASCTLAAECERMLAEATACVSSARPGCYGMSLCALMRGHAQRAGSPRAYARLFREHIDRCQSQP